MTPPTFRSLLDLPTLTASTSDSALLIVDAQNEYVSGKLKVTNIDSSRKVIGDLLAKYRKAGGKILHAMQTTPEGAPIFTPGTELAEEWEEIKAKDGEPTFPKKYPGAFEETKLHETLQSMGVKKLVLVGYMAHVCISTTAREAFQKDYQVVLVEDAIGDRDIPGVSGDDVTRVVLAELADVFGTVVKSADIN